MPPGGPKPKTLAKARWLRNRQPFLSDREMELAQRVRMGWGNKQIGEDLGITEETVKRHLWQINQVLGLDSRLALALWYGRQRVGEYEN